MNFGDLIANSTLGKKLFRDDLSERSKVRKELVESISALHKKLKNLPTVRIVEIDTEIKRTEQKLKEMKSKRSELVELENKARQSILDQIKLNEAALRKQAPAVVLKAIYSIHDRLNSRTLITVQQSALAKSLLEELNALITCLDDDFILKSVSDIESKAAVNL